MNVAEFIDTVLNTSASGTLPELATTDEIFQMISKLSVGEKLSVCVSVHKHTCKNTIHLHPSHAICVQKKLPKVALAEEKTSSTYSFIQLGFMPLRKFYKRECYFYVGAEKQAVFKRATGEIIYYKTIEDILADYEFDGLRVIKLEREVEFLNSQMQILLNHIAYSPGAPGYVETMKDFTERK